MKIFDALKKSKVQGNLPDDGSLLIRVNNKPFLGRIEEQKQFRAALKEILGAPKSETLPYIFLLYGDGGIGKTTLARRFRDIASDEVDFRGKFDLLWVDWEDEQKKFAALQVGREHISPESVFDVIFTVAQRNGWGKYFSAYKNAIQQRKVADKKAAETLSASGEKDEFALLRGASAGAIATFIRAKLPMVGNGGEELTKILLDAGIKIGAEQAYTLRTAVEARLRSRLGVEQFDLYVTPNESLARALADGIKRLAKHKHLLMFLDTYEIIDRADIWLRAVMQAAGPNILWSISGRNNLVNSRQFGSQYFKGYSEDFSRRLVAYDMRQLALTDVIRYFSACVPERPLDEKSAEAFRRATRGIPLAIEQAAEMWAKGIPLQEIVGNTDDATPQKEIVARMTERYLVHVQDGDKVALYALALAQGDLEILRAMLATRENNGFNLEQRLQDLARNYASVHAGENHLHEEPELFITRYLREPLRSATPDVAGLIESAVAVLRARIENIEAGIALIEERFEDDDWTRTALDLTHYLFWLDEQAGWQWLLPRFVESLAYSRPVQQGLLQAVSFGQKYFSQRGQKRLKLLAASFEQREFIPEMNEILDELEELTRQNGPGEQERLAILRLMRGRQDFYKKKYKDALAHFGWVENNLPASGVKLKTSLANMLDDLAGELIWRQNQSGAIYSAEAEIILEKVVAILPEKPGAWSRMGVNFAKANKSTEAEAAFERAIKLDPKDATAYSNLGTLLSDNPERSAEAEAAYRKAIELDPKLAQAYYNLGNLLRKDPERSAEAEAAYRKVIELDPKDATAWNGLGILYNLQKEYQKNLQAYQNAVELAPKQATYRASLVAALLRLNQNEEADRQSKIARKLMEKESDYNRACFEAICNNREEALQLLKIALEKKQVTIEWARRDPDFDSIRNNPHFKQLVRIE